LPEINHRLRETGSIKQYKNPLGITLGTGFGCRVILDGNLAHLQTPVFRHRVLIGGIEKMEYQELP
jgi:hypothetical protein